MESSNRSPTKWSAFHTFASPRLRANWESLESSRHSGRLTMAETLWIVVITMGVANMRSAVLVHRDIEWYCLHFLVVWQPVHASLKYSSRFNDHDMSHLLLHAAFTVGMAVQTAYLHHELHGFALATAALHALVAAAHVRVACRLPDARTFCVFRAAESAAAAALFVRLACSSGLQAAAAAARPEELHERRWLYAALLIEPLGTLSFRLATALVERRSLLHAMNVVGSDDTPTAPPPPPVAAAPRGVGGGVDGGSLGGSLGGRCGATPPRRPARVSAPDDDPSPPESPHRVLAQNVDIYLMQHGSSVGCTTSGRLHGARAPPFSQSARPAVLPRR